MAAIVGGRLESIFDQASKSSATGESATQFHATAQQHAQSFQDEVHEMAQQVRGHMEEFRDQMDDVSNQLVQTVEATEWQGQASEAKQERINEIHGEVTRFNGELETGVQEFQAQLMQAIEAFYVEIADRAGSVVGQMTETWESEAKHAQQMAQSLEELDAAAAGNA